MSRLLFLQEMLTFIRGVEALVSGTCSGVREGISSV